MTDTFLDIVTLVRIDLVFAALCIGVVFYLAGKKTVRIKKRDEWQKKADEFLRMFK